MVPPIRTSPPRTTTVTNPGVRPLPPTNTVVKPENAVVPSEKFFDGYGSLKDLFEKPLTRLDWMWKVLSKVTGKGSAGKAGWALREGPPVTDKTARYKAALEAAKKGQSQLPPDAKNYEYLFVGGYFSERAPTYFQDSMASLEKQGLDVHQVPIDTEGSTRQNASVIRQAILDAASRGKKVVLVGHSKGGVDSTAALSLYPDLKQHVRALTTIQTPYGGSPIASDLYNIGPVRYLARGALELLFGGSPDSLRDLTYEERQRFVREHPYPSDVPTVSLATSRVSPKSLLDPTSRYLWDRYGYKSDGLVVDQDAEIPGSQVVRLDDMDHLESTVKGVPGIVNYDPAHVSLALITLALETEKPAWIQERQASKLRAIG
jgi:hypothetical protein